MKLTQSMNSIPNLPLKMYSNPSQIIDKLSLPDKYKAALGDSIYSLQQYQQRQHKKQAYENKKKKIKELVIERHRQKKNSQLTHQEQKEKERERESRRQQRKQQSILEQQKEQKERREAIYYKMDEKGRMLDGDNNIVNIKQQGVQTLVINRNKVKE